MLLPVSQPYWRQPPPPTDRGFAAPLLRDFAGWWLHLGATVCVVATAVDVPLLLRAGATAEVVEATAAADCALGWLLAGFAALGACLVNLGVHRITRGRWNPTFNSAVAFAVALALGALVVVQVQRRGTLTQTAIAALFGALVATVWAAVLRGSWPGGLVALAVGGAALALDMTYRKTSYRELHDLLALLTLSGGIAAGAPLRRAIDALSARAQLGAILLGVAFSLWTFRGVDRLAPTWRAFASAHGRYASRLSRCARSLVDLDGDGFSPVAWGGDCDDLDPKRHPLARDAPGRGDLNCNQVDPPASATPEQRGLAPALGDPDLPDGAIDLVVLITIDCLRADALTEQAMPRLSALAARGLRFDRVYAGASSTAEATALIQRGTDSAAPVAMRLTRASISSTAVVGLSDPLLRPALEGFSHVELPSHRWDAATVTRRALADLEGAHGRHYLWIHYYDAHTPYGGGDSIGGVLAQVAAPSRDEYAAELATIDTQLGAFLDALEAAERLPRTLLVVTGDHGEAFGEHGVAFHHVSAYEQVVRVPAILAGPGVAARRFGGLVTHRDLPATIVGAFARAGAEPDVEEFGRSWLRLRAAPDGPLHRFVVIRSGRAVSGRASLSPILAIVEGRFKLVKGLEDTLFELFDELDDPAETRDLSAAEAVERARLSQHLALFRDLDGWPEWPAPVDPDER
jgi:hypothetical protein